LGLFESVPENSEIGFVYFDLGNVLVAFDPSIACANIAELFEVDVAAAQEVIYASGLQTRFEHGQVSAKQYADFIRRHLDRDVHQIATAEVLQAVSAMFRPIVSMGELLRRVQVSGLPIGVLSNTCVAHWQWILRQSYPMLDIEFAAMILSFEVGSMKPEEAIYQAAERAANVPAHQILFLDDKSENVEAARARGWKSELCVGGVQAEAALCRHGVINHRRVGS
jgi:FMN phosphatase YigB (HAD superfamily)